MQQQHRVGTWLPPPLADCCSLSERSPLAAAVIAAVPVPGCVVGENGACALNQETDYRGGEGECHCTVPLPLLIQIAVACFLWPSAEQAPSILARSCQSGRRGEGERRSKGGLSVPCSTGASGNNNTEGNGDKTDGERWGHDSLALPSLHYSLPSGSGGGCMNGHLSVGRMLLLLLWLWLWLLWQAHTCGTSLKLDVVPTAGDGAAAGDSPSLALSNMQESI